MFGWGRNSGAENNRENNHHVQYSQYHMQYYFPILLPIFYSACTHYIYYSIVCIFEQPLAQDFPSGLTKLDLISSYQGFVNVLVSRDLQMELNRLLGRLRRPHEKQSIKQAGFYCANNILTFTSMKTPSCCYYGPTAPSSGRAERSHIVIWIIFV